MSLTKYNNPEIPTTTQDDGWITFMDGGGNQPPPLVIGNYYMGKLVSAEDLVTHHGGPTGHYARMIFDLAGVQLQFTASLPSMFIKLEKCTKLRKALTALNWDGAQTIPSLIGRTCWCRIGKNRAGREVVDDLRVAVEENSTVKNNENSVQDGSPPLGN